MEVKKNPKSNLENFTKVFTLLGLVLALYIVYVAIEYKTYDRVVKELQAITLLSDEVEDMVFTQIKPKLSSPPPPPPPPPPPTPEKFEKVEDDVVIEEVAIEPTEEDVEEIVEIEDVEYSDEEEVVLVEDVPFAAIQNSAVYPGCEKEKDKKKCFSSKVNKFVSRNFDTDLAEELGLSGVQRLAAVFKIDTDGNIADIKIRARNPELKAEFEKTLKKLPQMIPASQNGRKVNLLFSLPLVFRVE